MITDLLAILLLCLVCMLFWQQRRQSELAKIAIQRKCDQLDLQLISTALKAHKIKTPDGVCAGIQSINLSFHHLVMTAIKVNSL
ncbi:hypothetical protein JCM19238_4587 [Vibrio ponticus]|nr:hypothetical protein JCM19238_4587 [Vibrio ponticus]